MRETELRLDFESISRDVPRFALQDSWLRLVPFVCNALEARKQVTESPQLLNDPLTNTQIRFLDEFDPELAAVQAIYEASRIDKKFPGGAIRIGQQVADKLFDISQQAQEQIQQH